MTLKKTITISIVLHICFFSAALLLSARLLEGSGKLPETEIVFISLVASEPQAVKTAAVPEKVRLVKKTVKPPAALKVKAIREDVIPEEFVSAAEETVSAELAAGNNLVQEKAVDHVEEIVIAQAVHAMPRSGSREADVPGQGSWLMPETIELITMAIERVKIYPVIARKRGIEGTVHVSFNVMADGTPHGIKILKSSGFSILDKATVRVVKKAAPFPLIASRIELPVAYRLRN